VLFALNERGAECRQLRLMLFEQAQARANDVARTAVAAVLDLRIDKIAEMLADAE
jgi:hypothetical protein